MRLLAGVVLRRELIRLSRRKQTWFVRFLYTSVLLGTILYLLAEEISRTTDPTHLMYLGNRLFDLYVGIQLFGVTVLAPVLVASGVQEEREAKTLDLMALTGVSAGRILTDQITSRLFVLFTVALSAAPAIAALNTFGGFGQMEVINAIVGTLSIGVILGTYAAFAALVTRGGPIAPVALTIPYAVLILVFPAALMALAVDDDAMFLASPLFGVYSHEPAALLAAAIWVPAVVSGFGLAVPVFRIVAGGDEHDDGFGLLSPDIWKVERFKRRTWGWAIAFGAALVAVWVANELFRLRGVGLFVLGWLASALFFAVIHRCSLLVTLWIGERLEYLQKNPIRWVRTRTNLEPRRVWRWPVLWREVATRATGTARALPLVIGALWLGMLAFASFFEGIDDTEMRMILAGWSGFGAFLIAPLVAIALTLDERRRRTLQLLFLTPMDPLDIAKQKTWAPVVFALPLIAAGTLLWATGPEVTGWRSHMSDVMGNPTPPDSHEFGPNLLTGVPLIGSLAWLAWQVLVAGNLGLVAAIVAAWVDNHRLAWAAALSAVALYVSWPFCIALGFDLFDLHGAIDTLEIAAYAWYPFADTRAVLCDYGGLPGTLVTGVVVQGVLMAIGWHLYSRTLQVAAR